MYTHAYVCRCTHAYMHTCLHVCMHYILFIGSIVLVEPSKPLHKTSDTLEDSKQETCAHNLLVNNNSFMKVKLCASQLLQHPVCHWRMMILLASNLTWGWGGGVFFTLLPDHAKSRNINVIQVGQLFIAVGAFGFGGRVIAVILCK